MSDVAGGTTDRGSGVPSARGYNAAFKGFVAVATGCGAEFRIYGQVGTGPEALLHVFDDGEVRAALMGRLYYRSDARARTGEKPQCEPENDAELAVAVYRHALADGLESLEGEFALVLHDRRRRELIAIRDPMGGYPIYWTRQNETLMLATGLRPLAALASMTELDIDYFGEVMTLPFTEIDHCEETPLRGIHRLPSGFILTAKGGELPRVRRYWDWLGRSVDPGPQTVAEIGARYGELLRAATRERLRGNVAAHLSGGMDSTSTALLAAQECFPLGRPVHALCLVYEKLTDLAIETPYLESALARPGIVAHRIPADDILDYDLFRNAPIHDEPFSGLYRCGTDIAMIDVAVANGCHTILTGMGADEVLDTAPFYMADLLRGGRVTEAWSEAARWARAHNTSPWRFFRQFAMAPLVPSFLQPGLGPLLRKGYASWSRQSHLTIAPWVRPGFAARTHIQKRIHDRMAYSSRSADTVVASDVLARLRYTCGDWVRYNLAAPRNVHIAHPFRDPRVLSFGLCARLRVRPAPGRQKAVLAEAMKDVLPEMILKRFDKGHFNAVYYGGLTRNLPALEDLAHDPAVTAHGLFDSAEMVRCMRDVALSYRSLYGKVGLDNSLVIAKWLSMLPRWKNLEDTPTRVMRDDHPA